MAITSLFHAVDYLSHVAALTPEELASLDSKGVEEGFRCVHQYLTQLYQKHRPELHDPKVQRGVRAVVAIARHASDKIDKIREKLPAAKAEYDQLQKFYLSKIVSHIGKGSRGEAWEGERHKGGTGAGEFHDLAVVRDDGSYELLMIYQEDGTPFYTPEFLHLLRLAGEAEDGLDRNGHIFFREVNLLLDRDARLSAKEVLEQCRTPIVEFLGSKTKKSSALQKAIIALLLAANPRNLLDTSVGKHCSDYFADAIRFLREATEEGGSEWKELRQKLASHMLLRTGGKGEIARTLGSFPGSEGEHLWEAIRHWDEALRTRFQKHPSGPLLKAFERFQGNRAGEGFDSSLQENPPRELFTVTGPGFYTTFMHLPAPVQQRIISKAAVVSEFEAYLSSLGDGHHLLVALEGKDSWKSEARLDALKELEKRRSHHLTLLLIDQEGEFYRQEGAFAEMNEAKKFLAAIPVSEEMRPAVKFLYQHLFGGRPELTRRERLDFLALLSGLSVWTLLERRPATTVSFTCKDGIDTGAAMQGLFFGMTRLLTSAEPWSHEEREFFLFTLYAPALLARHRPIDSEALSRTLSALETLDRALRDDRDGVLSAVQGLFPLALGAKLLYSPTT